MTTNPSAAFADAFGAVRSYADRAADDWRGLTPALLKVEVLAGLTVALALVPEAVAFALVAGVNPLVGLYAAFTIGLVTALIGGRPGMISGATGALAVVMVELVSSHGVEYLFATVVLMGLFQLTAGALRWGKFIRMVPYPVMLGFVNGLAIVIGLAQLEQFKIADGAGGHDWMSGPQLWLSLGLVALTMAVIWGLPKVTRAIPAPLAAIGIVAALVIGLGLPVPRVGDPELLQLGEADDDGQAVHEAQHDRIGHHADELAPPQRARDQLEEPHQDDGGEEVLHAVGADEFHHDHGEGARRARYHARAPADQRRDQPDGERGVEPDQRVHARHQREGHRLRHQRQRHRQPGQHLHLQQRRRQPAPVVGGGVHVRADSGEGVREGGRGVRRHGGPFVTGSGPLARMLQRSKRRSVSRASRTVPLPVPAAKGPR